MALALAQIEPADQDEQVDRPEFEPDTQIGRFLATMDKLMPWSTLADIVRPHVMVEPSLPTGISIESLLRLFFLQRWYGFSNDELADAVADSLAMARFSGYPKLLPSKAVSETIGSFNRLLEHNKLVVRLHRLSESCLASNRYVLVKSQRETPRLQPYRADDSKLAVLARLFASIEAPYEPADISRFNAIYRELYPGLDIAERQRAERYVDRLIEGLAKPSDAEKIYGVV